MAILDVEFFSRSLMRNVSFKAVLPNDKQSMACGEKLKTLYLLNGVFGSGKDWLMQSCLQEMAERKKLALILPNGENSFYIDRPEAGQLFSTFISKELVEFTRSVFPLSVKKEDTFIAGLSMGGYGALINGLNHPETFSWIGAFSPALVIDNALHSTNDPKVPILSRRSYFESIFGNLDNLSGSAWDYHALAADPKTSADFQHIFLSCGKQDFLYPEVKSFAKELDPNRFDVMVYFDEGDHNWDFWRTCLTRFFDQLPLDQNASYIGSGQALSMHEIQY